MKRRRKSVAITMILSIMMVVTMIPQMGGVANVYAKDGDPAISMVVNGSAPNIAGGGGGSTEGGVYFGNYAQSSDGEEGYNNEPIKWRVLRNADKKLFLLSDQNLDCKKFHNVKTDITYEYSTIRAWLNGYVSDEEESFINTAFSDKEQSSIAVTEVTADANPDHSTDQGGNVNDKVFLLSILEVMNADYGFQIDEGSTLLAKNTDYVRSKRAYTSDPVYGYWWLRSSGNLQHTAAISDSAGWLNTAGFNVEFFNLSVRPALNIDLGSVIFTSAATGGKDSNGVGKKALKSVGTNSNDEWKVTVKNGHDDFEITSSSYDNTEQVLTVNYSDAETSNSGNEYVSAIVVDNDGNITHYGNIKQCKNSSDASGKIEINLDGTLSCANASDVYIFNEQLNGDRKTDYSSALNKITIPAAGHKWDSGKVTKKATVNAKGVKTFTCTTCKTTKTKAIPKLKVSGTPVAKTTTKVKTSLTFGWAKIKNVDGYDIFFALCDHGDKKIACKKVKTIKGNKTFTWTKSGLKKGTAYKAYVKAYVMKNGKKSYVRTSPVMHAYTGGQTKNYTNAKSVTVNKDKVSLKKGKTFKIKGKVVKVNKNKKLMPKAHAPTLRYMTSNKKIATVSSSGKITAKGKGTCVIYVYAHNGISKQVKVTVK